MDAYLIGSLILAFIFFVMFYARRDLRKTMLYSASLYMVFTVGCFILLRLLTVDPAKTVNPGYWSPPTIFSLGQKTGGYGIEDLMFSFFAGGIVAGLYEFIFNLGINTRSKRKLKKHYALFFGILIGSLLYAFAPVNAIYFLIAIQLFSAVALVWQRRDLLIHAVAGGCLFLVFYALLFFAFNFIFPNFVSSYYHLERTSHLLLLGVPLEEYLYAMSLGVLWAPIYEYERNLRDSKRR